MIYDGFFIITVDCLSACSRVCFTVTLDKEKLGVMHMIQ